MNVKELIDALQEMPQDFPVYVLVDNALEDAEVWAGVIGDPFDDELDSVIIGPKKREATSE